MSVPQTAKVKELRAAQRDERRMTLEIALDPEQKADHKASERLLARLREHHAGSHGDI
jgi:hypothetical protein